MNEQIAEQVVEFDPAGWKPDRDRDTGEEIFSESDAIEAAAAMLNDDGIEIWTIWHAHDIAIEYQGKREYINLGLVYGSAAAALMEAMQEISCAIDAQDDTSCYLSSLHRRHYFHIRNSEPEAA